ncbi:MAG: hypothetical protein MHPSP_003194 [Paramarteilia canceri]
MGKLRGILGTSLVFGCSAAVLAALAARSGVKMDHVMLYLDKFRNYMGWNYAAKVTFSGNTTIKSTVKLALIEKIAVSSDTSMYKFQLQQKDFKSGLYPGN